MSPSDTRGTLIRAVLTHQNELIIDVGFSLMGGLISAELINLGNGIKLDIKEPINLSDSMGLINLAVSFQLARPETLKRVNVEGQHMSPVLTLRSMSPPPYNPLKCVAKKKCHQLLISPLM